MTDRTKTPTEDEYRLVDKLLEELMVKHFEMAEMCAQYRDLIGDLSERPWDPDRRRLAGALPGARYHIAMTFAREQGLKIEAELKRMFPRE